MPITHFMCVGSLIAERLGGSHPLLSSLNDGALTDERLEVHNVDAVEFLKRSSTLYDVIVAEQPELLK